MTAFPYLAIQNRTAYVLRKFPFPALSSSCRRQWGVLYLFMGFNSFRWWIFQAAQAAKRRAWGGNPNKIPAGQNEQLAKFGTVVESCSKKVAASAVWVSLNTSSAASEDFAKVTAIFSPYYLQPHKAKMMVIYGNFPLFLTKPHKPE